jgi:hypothetical protein
MVNAAGDGHRAVSAMAFRPSPQRAAFDIAAIIGLFLAGLWLIGPQMQSSPWAVMVYWLMVAAAAWLILRPCTWWGGEERPQIGRVQNGWRVYLAGAGLAVAGLVMIAAALHHGMAVHIDPRSVALKFAGYLPFAAIQAFALFHFVQPRVTRLLLAAFPKSASRRLAVAGVMGLLFLLIHAPNPAMMALTLVGGAAWSWAHSRWPNLPLVILSHAVLGTCVHRVLQISTRIGPFYDRPDLHVLQAAIPGLRQLFGNLF